MAKLIILSANGLSPGRSDCSACVNAPIITKISRYSLADIPPQIPSFTPFASPYKPVHGIITEPRLKRINSPVPIPQVQVAMPRTEEAEAFFHAAYSAICEIPRGRVTSYGHIAALIGTRRSFFFYLIYSKKAILKKTQLSITPAQRPRQVGVCLKHLTDDTTQRFNHESVPWQRVVNAKGIISPRGHPTAVRTQAELLRDEGVEVSRGGLGEMSVDLGEYGWFPDILPSEDPATQARGQERRRGRGRGRGSNGVDGVDGDGGVAIFQDEQQDFIKREAKD